MFPLLGFYGPARGFNAFPYHQQKQRVFGSVKSFYGGHMITDPLRRACCRHSCPKGDFFSSKTHFMIAQASFFSGLVLDL